MEEFNVSHNFGLNNIAMSMRHTQTRNAKVVEEVVETQITKKRGVGRATTRLRKIDVVREGWLAISLDAMVGVDRTKEKCWQRIEDTTITMWPFPATAQLAISLIV